jgi:hypothetical protein
VGDEFGPAAGFVRGGQVHRGGPDQMSGVPDGESLRPVRREQRDQVAPADT